ncbi:hypothetical protein DXG01_014247 [Tephrocybe rancida]|nr:hypothetical protein DXG01_014247 [Tephrocybe rancida]
MRDAIKSTYFDQMPTWNFSTALSNNQLLSAVERLQIPELLTHSIIAMDAFTTFDFSLDVTLEDTLSSSVSPSRGHGDVMQELIDADQKLGYGGYCVIA